MVRSFPEHWQALMAGSALDNLTPDEAQELQQLLQTHPELATEIDRLQDTLALLPRALPQPEMPPRLRTQVLSAVQSGQAVPRRDRTRYRSVWLALGGAVAAGLVLALAVDNIRLRRSVADKRAVLTALQQPNAQLYALQGSEKVPSASGQLVLNSAQQTVVVRVQDLPVLPDDRAYRLWAVSDDRSQPAYCGQFNLGRETATTSWTIPDAQCSTEVAQLLITNESAADPPIPAGDLVLHSPP